VRCQAAAVVCVEKRIRCTYIHAYIPDVESVLVVYYDGPGMERQGKERSVFGHWENALVMSPFASVAGREFFLKFFFNIGDLLYVLSW